MSALSAVTLAADPAFGSSPPYILFFPLPADEAWAKVEFLADEGVLISTSISSMNTTGNGSWCRLVVFQVFDAAEGIFFLLVLWWEPKRAT
jgi:hypothetical protein